MQTYSLSEAKAKFSEVIAKAMAGEEIVVTKQGKEAARILPPERKKRMPKRTGFLKGRVYMTDDFDKLPDDIARAFGMID